MKTKSILIPIALLLITFRLLAQENVKTLLAEAEKLEHNMKETEALFKYKNVLNLEPNNFKAITKTSWLSSRIGYRLTNVEKKREYFQSAILYAQKALTINANSAESNYVMAVAKARMAQISGARERVSMLHDIQQFGLKCISLDPKHAGGYHVLGRLNLRVANLNAAEKAAANLILGGIPKNMSNENAVTYLKKAINLNPTYILYWKDIGLAYSKLNQRSLAITAFKKALSLPIQTEDDEGYKLSCKSMLAKLEK